MVGSPACVAHYADDPCRLPVVTAIDRIEETDSWRDYNMGGAARLVQLLARLGRRILRCSQQKRDYAVFSLFLCQKSENLFTLLLGLRLGESMSQLC
jgi:hypothetical protein